MYTNVYIYVPLNILMEIGKLFKIVYMDRNYTKVIQGKILNVDTHLICIADRKEGKLWIGKNCIVKLQEVQ